MTEQDLWVHFTQEQLQEYLDLLKDPDAAAGYLASVLKLHKYRFDAREAILLDYATYSLDFAHKQSFGPTRKASWYNVAHRVLQTCIGGAPYEECEACFKGLMLQLVRPRPGTDTPYFSPDQVAAVGGFMAHGLFRHYRLYQHVFSTEQAHISYTAELQVETARVPSFEAAMSQAEWDAMHEKRRLEAERTKKAAEEAEAARLAEEARQAEEAAKRFAEEARKAELAKKPATLDEAVAQLVAVRLEAEKEILAAEYRAKEEEMRAKITELEETLATRKPPSAGGAKKKEAKEAREKEAAREAAKEAAAAGS
ncbi:hypothetical protein VOLCADRAFT_107162 [Volvox carteri f. nagariensis]|uniref:Flagellar associated protein n=1 Tax=Volvox carteri f. nagariensis TaxID=3068 RepID=D8UCC6_VOLCA|nr:uncharacterized protein VOLCADRAFT_107162 [Volvox carteri f. nagariensis]EFJ42622.1 hypothetical protein VOLCADRAFT_107162 [Volvox carteri f. nagariensis]|eukprot:XP_002956273.1 hypothetical protein VOLCADRAFT_107162 [Volvox carteri f. nagariensis]